MAQLASAKKLIVKGENMVDILHSEADFTTAPSVHRPMLSPREQLVADMVCTGLSNKQIAVRAGLSEHTVSSYLRRIYGKLGVNNRVGLVITLR